MGFTKENNGWLPLSKLPAPFPHTAPHHTTTRAYHAADEGQLVFKKRTLLLLCFAPNSERDCSPRKTCAKLGLKLNGINFCCCKKRTTTTIKDRHFCACGAYRVACVACSAGMRVKCIFPPATSWRIIMAPWPVRSVKVTEISDCSANLNRAPAPTPSHSLHSMRPVRKPHKPLVPRRTQLQLAYAGVFLALWYYVLPRAVFICQSIWPVIHPHQSGTVLYRSWMQFDVDTRTRATTLQFLGERALFSVLLNIWITCCSCTTALDREMGDTFVCFSTS